MSTYDSIGVAPLWRLAMSSASAPLNEGGQVDLIRTAEAPYICARSFANIYLLIVWFAAPFKARQIESTVDAALPEIERLTLDLPPDGPDRPAVSAKQEP